MAPISLWKGENVLSWPIVTGHDRQLSCRIFYTSTGSKWHKAASLADFEMVGNNNFDHFSRLQV
ncbi:MAG TPA: hypothetical protein VMV75_00125 [Sulfuricella sp.]|nr:hypothetical protein [Sulfuricella sp.]